MYLIPLSIPANLSILIRFRIGQQFGKHLTRISTLCFEFDWEEKPSYSFGILVVRRNNLDARKKKQNLQESDFHEPHSELRTLRFMTLVLR